MGNNNRLPQILLVLVLILGVVGILINLPHVGHVTFNISVGVCVNHPPQTNTTCSMNVTEDDLLNCSFGYDGDGDTLVYSLIFMNTSLFSLGSEGEVLKQLDENDIGNYTFNLTITDDSVCSNNQTTQQYNLTVNSVGNHPPYLIRPIPNQKWMQDTTLVAFDLDTHIGDLDEDILIFDVTPNNNIHITIDSNNLVTLDPITGFYGTVYVTFNATDPSNETLNVTVRLEVEKKEISEEEEVEKTETVSSSMPSIPGAMEITCFPDWECGEWSNCYPQGIKIRDCIDKLNCSISLNKPNTTESCEYIPSCLDEVKNGLEEGVDCGGLCEKKCKNPEEDNELNDEIKDKDCEGEDCEIKAHEESPTQIDKELMMNLGIILAILAALISSTYYSMTHQRELKRLSKRFKKLFKKEIPLVPLKDNPLNALDKLELKLEELKTENALPLLSNILKHHIYSLLNIKETLTNEDLIKEIPKLQIDKKIQGTTIELLNELNELEYATEKNITKTSVQSMIYEIRNIILSTIKNNTKINYNKIIKFKEEKTTDFIFNLVIDTHINIMNSNINNARLSYMTLYHEVQKNKIKDKGLINSIKRTHNMLRYYNEKK